MNPHAKRLLFRPPKSISDAKSPALPKLIAVRNNTEMDTNRSRIRDLGINDRRYLESAQGWLGLGRWMEANEELELITPKMRAHPDVLCVRWEVYAAAKKWEMAAEIARSISVMLPDFAFGWIHWAYSLHEMKRTKEAWGVLLPVADKFPGEHTIPYNLACYACQLGDAKAGWQWLEKALEIADESAVKLQALEDPDLEPLWREIAEI